MRFLAFFLLAFWLLTFASTILNLLLVPRLRAGQRPLRESLVSVIIPARDEERMIERTVRAMLAQTHPALEIIVVNDRSTDATGAILASIADARLRVIAGDEPPPGWLGKTWALHQGSMHARGEVLLFVDADVIYEPEAISAALARMEKSAVAMVSLLPKLEMHGFWEHLAMPNLTTMVFTVLPTWLANRTRISVLGAGGGPGNLVRRDDYDAAGGHVALKDAVVDDVALARLIRRSGQRTEIVLADDLVSVRMYEGLRQIVEGFTKNTFTVFGRNYIAAIIIVIGSLLVHLGPYILALTGDAVAIASVVALTLVRVVLFAALHYRLDNAVLGASPMVVLWSFIFLRSAWITGVRGELLWRGRSYDARRTRFGAD